MEQPADERPEECRCGYPSRWAANPDVPVRFYERFGEFHLLERGGGYLILRYCFWCGGRLPESKRGEFFSKPDEAELAEIARLLDGAKTAEEAFRALGPPDRTMDGDDPPVCRDDEQDVRWRRCHTYGSRWTSVDLTLLEMPDGSFSRMTSGKWVGPPSGEGESDCGVEHP